MDRMHRGSIVFERFVRRSPTVANARQDGGIGRLKMDQSG